MSDDPILISIEDAEYFDLLDNIEYKYVKNIIKKGLPIPISIYVSSVDDNAVVSFQIHLSADKHWEVERNFMWKSPYGYKVQRLVTKFGILNEF